MDLELLGAPAQVDLMAREGGEIDPGMTRQGRRDDKLRAELLGHRLQSAGCVHGIADGGERSRPAVAHLADDDGTTVQADADAQRLRQVVRQAAVQLVERLRRAGPLWRRRTGPAGRPMPRRSGSGRGCARLRFSSSSDCAMRRAASRALRLPCSMPCSMPNSAITPSPMNLSMRPPACSTAVPMAVK